MHVVLDTNALLLPFTDQVDLESECSRLFGAVEWVVPSCVDAELERLQERGGPAGAQARAAARWAAPLRREATDLPGDDGVLDVAGRLDAALVSNDRTLQQQARRRGLRVAASRGPGRLHEIV